MEPERGDRSVRVTRQEVAAAARSVGILPGDTVMFHSALSSMGTVDGGPDTVIDGFLDAVDPAGTVAVPTLCNWKADEQHLVFPNWNIGTTPSYVGLITETFRQRPNAVRSNHATHSVAAIGARAAELTANHSAAGWRRGPFGDAAFCQSSPWERLVEWNAAYCFIGVTFRVCTMVHYVESLVVERALRPLKPADQARLIALVVDWMKVGVWPSIRIEDRELIEKLLAEKGIVRYGKIGSATLRCVRTRTMVSEWLRYMEPEPQRWFPEGFVAWLAEVEKARGGRA